MNITGYRPIMYPRIKLGICVFLAVMLISLASGLISTVDKMVSYPFRTVEPEKMYYIMNGEFVEGDVYRDRVMLYYQDRIGADEYTNLLVLTPENKVVLLRGKNEEIGDYYSYELMMEGVYDSFWYAGEVVPLEGETLTNTLHHLSADLRSEYGITVDDISCTYVRLGMHDSQPTWDHLWRYIFPMVVVLALLCSLLWPFVRNLKYRFTVKKRGTASAAIWNAGNAAPHRSGTDRFWLEADGALDKDASEEYNNGNNENFSDPFVR